MNHLFFEPFCLGFPCLSDSPRHHFLVSHADLSVLTSFLNAFRFLMVREDQLSQFVPANTVQRVRKIVCIPALPLAAGAVQATELDQLHAAPELLVL